MNINDFELTNLKKILDEYISQFNILYKQKLMDSGIAPNSKLIQSIKTSVNFDGEMYSVELNIADYYIFVEEGRKPGKQPPLNIIKSWVKEKNIIPREKNGNLPTQDQLAYLIARKIGEEGIKPGHQLKDTLEEMNRIYEIKIKNAFEQDLADFQLKILEQINKIVKI